MTRAKCLTGRMNCPRFMSNERQAEHISLQMPQLGMQTMFDRWIELSVYWSEKKLLHEIKVDPLKQK